MRHYVTFFLKTSFLFLFQLIVKMSPKPFSCVQCSKSYKTGKLLRQHIRQKHGDEAQTSNLTCQVCKKILNKPRNLLEHKEAYQHFVIDDVVAEQTKLYMCPHCNYQTNIENFFKKHYNTTHSALKPNADFTNLLYQFKCPFKDCDASTYSKDIMRYHFFKVHASEKAFLEHKQKYAYSFCNKCSLNIKNENFKTHFETCTN